MVRHRAPSCAVFAHRTPRHAGIQHQAKMRGGSFEPVALVESVRVRALQPRIQATVGTPIRTRVNASMWLARSSRMHRNRVLPQCDRTKGSPAHNTSIALSAATRVSPPMFIAPQLHTRLHSKPRSTSVQSYPPFQRMRSTSKRESVTPNRRPMRFVSVCEDQWLTSLRREHVLTRCSGFIYLRHSSTRSRFNCCFNRGPEARQCV